MMKKMGKGGKLKQAMAAMTGKGMPGMPGGGAGGLGGMEPQSAGGCGQSQMASGRAVCGAAGWAVCLVCEGREMRYPVLETENLFLAAKPLPQDSRPKPPARATGLA